MFIGVHNDAIKSLKRLTFTRESEINLLLTNKVSMVIFYYKNIDIILTNIVWELLEAYYVLLVIPSM